MIDLVKADLVLTAYVTSPTDITSDLLRPIYGDWGGDRQSRLVGTGSVEFDLKNTTTVGKYVFGHANKLAGWKKGTKIEFAFTFDSRERVKVFYVSSCQVTGPRDERVHVVALDWIENAAKYPLVHPQLLEDERVDAAITELLTDFPVQPQSTNLDPGVIELEYIFDTTQRTTKAYTELAKLTNSELGNIGLRQPEELVFQNMKARNGMNALHEVPVYSEDAGPLLDETSDPILDQNGDPIFAGMRETVSVSTDDGVILNYENENGENIINRYTSTAHRRRIDLAPIVIFLSERPIFVPSGGRRIVREYYFDPVSKRPINAVPPEADPYTKGLLHFEGTVGHKNTSSELLDETGRVWNPVDVEYVNDVFGTPPKFGDTCLYMDGSASYLYTAHSTDLELETDDFTFDWWEYRFSTTSGYVSISRDKDASFPAFIFARSNGSSLLVDISSNGSSNDIANGKTMGTITTGQWVHLAVVRSGNTFYTFKNGIMQDTWTSSASIFASSSSLYVGVHGGVYFDGTMDEIRISKGIARWTANFTPPTEPYELEGSFVTAFSNREATGTDISDDVTVSADYGTEGAIYNIYNNNAAFNAWVFIRTIGRGIHLDSPTDDIQTSQPSVDEHGFQDNSIDLAYHEDTYLGILEGKREIEREKNSRTVLETVEMSANKSPSDMMRFLYTDFGHLTHIEVPRLAKDTRFWVEGGKWNWMGAGLINYTWKLREHFSHYSGLDDLAIEYRGGANQDGITFDYMPYIAGDDVTAFAISTWVYLDTKPSANFYFLAGPFGDGFGSMLYLQPDGANFRVAFYTSRFNVSPGTWRSATDPFSLSTWVHLLVSWNISLTDDPTIYLNGSPLSLTETNTPAGALMSAVGCPFFMGNVKTPTYDYSRCLDGKLKDTRFYNQRVEQGQVSEIYNGGTVDLFAGTENMVLQAPAIFSDRLSDYTNLTLTEDDKVLDAFLLFAGTPSGSPIARLP